MNASEVHLAQIGRLAGVGRPAVVNWRRRHADFPPAIGGTAESPVFRRAEVEDWLRTHGKIREPERPAAPATIVFADGLAVTVHVPALVAVGQGGSGYEEFGGFIDRDAPVPWPAADLERADVPGQAPFRVERAGVDISYAASPAWRYLKLIWPAERRHQLDTAAGEPAQITEVHR